MTEPVIVVFTKKELETIHNRARGRWLEIPNDARLPGSSEDLESRHRATLAWLLSCLEALHAKKVAVNAHIQLDSPDLEPDTDP